MNPEHVPWSEEETIVISYLMFNTNLSNEECGEYINRTAKAVSAKKSNAGLAHKMLHEKIPGEELHKILINYGVINE